MLYLQVKQERIRANIRFIEQRGKRFSMLSIKDNVSLLDEETVNKINEVVARPGISYLKKSEGCPVKADTYVLETDSIMVYNAICYSINQ